MMMFQSGWSVDSQILHALTNLRGVGNQKALGLYGANAGRVAYDHARDVFEELASGHGRPAAEYQPVWDDSVRRLEKCSDAQIHVISYHEPGYPQRLRKIDDPPVVLFARGNTGALEGPPSVAIVGTREPTDYGQRAASKAGRAAADMGISVVSGLALGCDTQAHQGCVDGAGTGVAVLAHGPDFIYPAANRQLAEELVDFGGCLVSELPAGEKPRRGTFVKRDRIQSGLADRVLVIETDVKGGTMHTVGFCKKQGRPLGCIEHPAPYRDKSQAQGNRMLIDDGSAVPIRDPDELVGFLKAILGPDQGSGTGEDEVAGADGQQLSFPI